MCSTRHVADRSGHRADLRGADPAAPFNRFLNLHSNSPVPPTSPYNIIPFAVMAGGWLAPLLMFWLYVWGPMRPFSYPAGELFPNVLVFVLCLAACVTTWSMPPGYFRVRDFERTGRVYEALGVRWFRRIVPDGDVANSWRRRSDPYYRMVRNRETATAFIARTEQSERGHLVLLTGGVLSACFAWQIGWPGWAVYLAVGNVAVNLYPILLQRYTRSRLAAISKQRTRTDNEGTDLS